jgi:hypothetical protein
LLFNQLKGSASGGNLHGTTGNCRHEWKFSYAVDVGRSRLASI